LPEANATLFERFRAVLKKENRSESAVYDGALMQVRKKNLILSEGLDLQEEDEQITHQIRLDEESDVQESLSESKFFLVLLVKTMRI
jgi:pre-mRNA-splicing factor CWC22